MSIDEAIKRPPDNEFTKSDAITAIQESKCDFTMSRATSEDELKAIRIGYDMAINAIENMGENDDSDDSDDEDYRLDPCDDCRAYGNDYYMDEYGNLTDACKDCFYNEVNQEEEGFEW